MASKSVQTVLELPRSVTNLSKGKTETAKIKADFRNPLPSGMVLLASLPLEAELDTDARLDRAIFKYGEFKNVKRGNEWVPVHRHVFEVAVVKTKIPKNYSSSHYYPDFSRLCDNKIEREEYVDESESLYRMLTIFKCTPTGTEQATGGAVMHLELEGTSVLLTHQWIGNALAHKENIAATKKRWQSARLCLLGAGKGDPGVCPIGRYDGSADFNRHCAFSAEVAVFPRSMEFDLGAEREQWLSLGIGRNLANGFNDKVIDLFVKDIENVIKKNPDLPVVARLMVSGGSAGTMLNDSLVSRSVAEKIGKALRNKGYRPNQILTGINPTCRADLEWVFPDKNSRYQIVPAPPA